MTVQGKLLVMLAAQSSWSMNIIVRILLYLTHIWNEYIKEKDQNRYGSKRLEHPRPEFYAIYTDGRRTRPEWIRLLEEFFDGNKDFLEVQVKVLYGEEEVIDIMMELFDQEKAVEKYGYDKMKEGELKKAKETTLNMKREGMSDMIIARVLNVGQEVVQQWFSGADIARL